MTFNQPADHSANDRTNRPPAGTTVSRSSAPSGDDLVQRVSTAESERGVEWLWPGRVPLGAITMLAGDPGVGKSFLTLDMAACVSRGIEWPDDAPNETGSSIIISTEDCWGTISGRLRALGADPERIRGLNSVKFELGRDLPVLARAVEQMEDCRLVVIDPVTDYLGRTSENANKQVRQLLAPLADLAQSHRLAVVLITHLCKKGGLAQHQMLGCQAFVALARATWIIKCDPLRQDRRILFSPKRNLGPNPGGLAFWIGPSVEGGPAVLLWENGVVDVPIDDPEPMRQPANRPAIRRQKAIDWLGWFLRSGAKPATEVNQMGQRYGFSEATLRRARCELGVEVVKSKGTRHGCWLWRLPSKHQIS